MLKLHQTTRKHELYPHNFDKMTKTKRTHPSTSSASRQQPTKASKQKGLSCHPMAPCKAVTNVILKTIAEEIHSRIEKVHQTKESKYGIEKKVLEQFKESQPWLNRNLYNYYVKQNLPP